MYVPNEITSFCFILQIGSMWREYLFYRIFIDAALVAGGHVCSKWDPYMDASYKHLPPRNSVLKALRLTNGALEALKSVRYHIVTNIMVNRQCRQ